MWINVGVCMLLNSCVSLACSVHTSNAAAAATATRSLTLITGINISYHFIIKFIYIQFRQKKKVKKRTFNCEKYIICEVKATW